MAEKYNIKRYWKYVVLLKIVLLSNASWTHIFKSIYFGFNPYFYINISKSELAIVKGISISIPIWNWDSNSWFLFELKILVLFFNILTEPLSPFSLSNLIHHEGSSKKWISLWFFYWFLCKGVLLEIMASTHNYYNFKKVYLTHIFKSAIISR